LQTRLEPHIITLGELLLQGLDSRDAALARHCQRLLACFPMLWLFSTVDGVEPTTKPNGCNAAPSGCRFVERILTVVQSLRLQGRNTLEFLGQTLAAHREGLSTPTLCPVG
jgi:transposase